jgi:hypothetical protein
MDIQWKKETETCRHARPRAAKKPLPLYIERWPYLETRVQPHQIPPHRLETSLHGKRLISPSIGRRSSTHQSAGPGFTTDGRTKTTRTHCEYQRCTQSGRPRATGKVIIVAYNEPHPAGQMCVLAKHSLYQITTLILLDRCTSCRVLEAATLQRAPASSVIRCASMYSVDSLVTVFTPWGHPLLECTLSRLYAVDAYDETTKWQNSWEIDVAHASS